MCYDFGVFGLLYRTKSLQEASRLTPVEEQGVGSSQCRRIDYGHTYNAVDGSCLLELPVVSVTSSGGQYGKMFEIELFRMTT